MITTHYIVVLTRHKCRIVDTMSYRLVSSLVSRILVSYLVSYRQVSYRLVSSLVSRKLRLVVSNLVSSYET